MSQQDGITYTLDKNSLVEQWPFVPEHVVVLELTGHNPDDSTLVRWFARWNHEIFVEVSEGQFKALWQHIEISEAQRKANEGRS